MRTLALAALLVACSAAEDGKTTPVAPTSHVTPELMAGHWCNDGLCLQLDASNYGPQWMTYDWTSDACRESGFAQVVDEQLNMGPFYGKGCFGAKYTASFSMGGDGTAYVQLSTQAQPLELTQQ